MNFKTQLTATPALNVELAYVVGNESRSFPTVISFSTIYLKCNELYLLVNLAFPIPITWWHSEICSFVMFIKEEFTQQWICRTFKENTLMSFATHYIYIVKILHKRTWCTHRPNCARKRTQWNDAFVTFGSCACLEDCPIVTNLHAWSIQLEISELRIVNSRPLSFSHGWAGRRIELRLICTLQIILPASSCFASLHQWEFETGLLHKNMSYSKSIQRYSYIPDIIIYTMYFFCIKTNQRTLNQNTKQVLSLFLSFKCHGSNELKWSGEPNASLLQW